MLETFSAPGRFCKGMLHCHSTRSDADIDPDQVCRIYREAGYDFISLTDHFLAEYDFPIVDTTPFRTDEFTTLLGAELHAGQMSAGEMWHIVAVGLPADFAPTKEHETGPALARRAADAGAFVALPHPEWYALTLEDGLSVDAAMAVELVNGMCGHESGRGQGSALLDQLLNTGRRVGCIATDDAHRYGPELHSGWVMVKATDNTPDAILSALKAGHYYATEGPVIEDITREGDDLVIRSTPITTIRLIGTGSRSETVHGTDMTTARLPLAPFADGWCRTVLTDGTGKRAWSNPLWLG